MRSVCGTIAPPFSICGGDVFEGRRRGAVLRLDAHAFCQALGRHASAHVGNTVDHHHAVSAAADGAKMPRGSLWRCLAVAVHLDASRTQGNGDRLTLSLECLPVGEADRAPLSVVPRIGCSSAFPARSLPKLSAGLDRASPGSCPTFRGFSAPRIPFTWEIRWVLQESEPNEHGNGVSHA